MREDYEASFDSTDTLDTRDIAIRVSNPSQGVGEKDENIVEASEECLDLLSGVLGDLEKKEDHAEDEKTDDQSKTLLPGCSLEIEKEETSSENILTEEGAEQTEDEVAVREKEASLRREEDVLLKSWELDRRREDIKVEYIEENPIAADEAISEEEIEEAYAVIENSVSETNKSRMEIIQAVEDLSEKLERELGPDHVVKREDFDGKNGNCSGTSGKSEDEEVVLRRRTLSGSSTPPCRLSDTFCEEIFSELSGTLDRPLASKDKLSKSDITSISTFQPTNADDHKVVRCVSEKPPIKTEGAQAVLGQDSLLRTSEVPSDQNLSAAPSMPSMSSSLPSSFLVSLSPSPSQSLSHSSTSPEGETLSDTSICVEGEDRSGVAS